jgi:hypothetical protein
MQTLFNTLLDNVLDYVAGEVYMQTITKGYSSVARRFI